MDNLELLFLFRLFERLLGVGIGGLAIYLGYRLFVLLPFQTDSTGKLEMPGHSVVFSRVGPGIFFAAFGALVLYHNLSQEVTLHHQIEKKGKDVVKESKKIIGATPDFPDISSVTAPQDKIAEIPLRIQVLNCIEKKGIRNQPEFFERHLTLAVRDAKVALLGSIWDAERWGDFKSFNDWAHDESVKLSGSDEIQNVFTSLYPDCT